MRAIYIRSPDALIFAEAETPKPAKGEVLIKVAAAGLNRADLLQRQGKYPAPPGSSTILGMEVSGEVTALGADAKRWKIGARVCALLSGGGYAEYVAVSEDQCLAVPPNLSMLEAAALPEAVVTVWANIFLSAGLKPKDTILVHGGASGIGTTAIQMVKLFGAKIFVTAGSEDKCKACRMLGADLAINYKTTDFLESIKQLTEGRGVDIVLDMIGGDYLSRNLAALAPFGRHLSIATQKGPMASIDLREVMQKRLMITGSTLRGRPADEKAHLVLEVETKVWPWVKSNKLKPLIYKSFPIKEAMEAHKMMESGAHIGKIVLEVMS